MIRRHSVLFVIITVAVAILIGGFAATKHNSSTANESIPSPDSKTTHCPGHEPNTPDGPDPWGGCWPGPSTTGVPVGTPLSTYTGPNTITADGTTIDSKLITGCVVIQANRVTIKNSLFRSNGCYFNILSDNGNTDLQLTDVEIDGQNNTTGDSAISGSGYTCLRCNLHGTGDSAKAGSNVIFRDSYIHDLALTATSHNDGIQSLGTTSLQIIHNTIVIKGGATSAIILSTSAASEMRNVLVERNLLAGGAYTVYGGYLTGTDELSRVSDISITDNRISTIIYPGGGAYGPITSSDPPAVGLSGNVWADGPSSGKSIG